MPKLLPVIQVDPNGPWQTDPETGLTLLVASVRDPELVKSFHEGEVKSGDIIIEFQPNDPEKDQTRNEYGWGSLSIIRHWWPNREWVMVALEGERETPQVEVLPQDQLVEEVPTDD